MVGCVVREWGSSAGTVVVGLELVESGELFLSCCDVLARHGVVVEEWLRAVMMRCLSSETT